MSFPAKFAGICRGCGGRINVGDSIVWKADKGVWHEACEPAPPAVDFTGMERYLKAKHGEALAAGFKPMQPLKPGESAMLEWSHKVNASVGIYWEKGRGFFGRGFDETMD